MSAIDLRVRAAGWLRSPVVRFRVAIISALLLSLALLLSPATELAGFIAAGLTTVLGLAAVVWMQWHYGKIDSPLLTDGGFHPRRGLLIYVAVTPWQIVWRVLAYGLAAAALLWAVIHGYPGLEDPVNNIVAAVLLIAAPGWLLQELVSSIVVRRWSVTPPRHVVLGYLVASTGLMFLSGVPVARACITYLGQRFPDWGVEWLTWVPVLSPMCLVVVTWLRDMVVSSWQARLDAQTEQLKEAERGRKLAEAQLAMLQAQIEPHFLYNTLASVQYLVRRDSASADFLLTHLIRYLRHAMPKMRRPLSTLAQEFELADAFLQIARMRMGGRLTVEVELAQHLHEVPFPPLVLQTLVENALKHGVEPKLGPVDITVRAEVHHAGDAPRLQIEVLDNGVGLGRADTAGSGAGLANIRERLAGIYGDRASLVVANAPGGGVVSRVSVPLEEGQA